MTAGAGPEAKITGVCTALTVAVQIRCNNHIMYTDTVDLAGIIIDFCIVKQMLLLFALNSVQIYNGRHRLLVESHI